MNSETGNGALTLMETKGAAVIPRMKRLQFIFRSRVTAVLAVTFIGCLPVSSAAQPTISSLPSPLAGSWLLTGSPPTGAGGSSGARADRKLDTNDVALAASFTVDGKKVEAVISMLWPCGTGFAGGHIPYIAGTIDPDGNFELSNRSENGYTPDMSVTLTGKIPNPGELSWSGSYSLDAAGRDGCRTVSGPFQATPIMLRPGRYEGSGTALIYAPDRKVHPSPISAAKVRAILWLEGNGQGDIALDGRGRLVGRKEHATLAIEGGICGKPTEKNVEISIEGSTLGANFSGDDGSLVGLTGYVESAEGSKLRLDIGLIHLGSCDTTFDLKLTVSLVDPGAGNGETATTDTHFKE